MASLTLDLSLVLSIQISQSKLTLTLWGRRNPNPTLDYKTRTILLTSTQQFSSRSWVFFQMDVFSPRFKHQAAIFCKPAEGNIIKPFTKGFSRQLLYMLLHNASGFVAVCLGPHVKCFNVKTTFDPERFILFISLLLPKMHRYIVNASKYLSVKSRHSPFR